MPPVCFYCNVKIPLNESYQCYKCNINTIIPCINCNEYYINCSNCKKSLDLKIFYKNFTNNCVCGKKIKNN